MEGCFVLHLRFYNELFALTVKSLGIKYEIKDKSQAVDLLHSFLFSAHENFKYGGLIPDHGRLKFD